MKVFEFAGIIFNADKICTIQKVNLGKEGIDEVSPGFQIVTVAGGFSFAFENEKERDLKFAELLQYLDDENVMTSDAGDKGKIVFRNTVDDEATRKKLNPEAEQRDKENNIK